MNAYINILSPGGYFFLPPTFIHTVITFDMSAMFTLNLVIEDWAETAKRSCSIEVAFICNMVLQYEENKKAKMKDAMAEKEAKIKLVVKRWERNLIMLRQLIVEDDINTRSTGAGLEYILGKYDWMADLLGRLCLGFPQEFI